jgi:hypothetical protein
MPQKYMKFKEIQACEIKKWILIENFTFLLLPTCYLPQDRDSINPYILPASPA